MKGYFLLLSTLFFSGILISQNVGINAPSPNGTLHVRGASSIPYPNLRLTDTLDNFARIKMETTIGGDRFWDIAASSTPGFSWMNYYFKNDTLGSNIFQISPESGHIFHNSLSPEVRKIYFANGNEYQGTVGFINENLNLIAGRPEGNLWLGTRNYTRMVLDTIGRLGLGTLGPKFQFDMRSSNNTSKGTIMQMATPSETNFIRFFSGRLGNPNPYMAFNDLDTFHIATTSADWSTYKRRFTMLPNGFIGLGTEKPFVELDIRSADIDDGVEMHLSNLDTSHFLRLFSGRQNLPNAITYWNHGDTLEFGTANPDESDYKRFLTFDGKTIGFHHTNKSVFLGKEAGQNGFQFNSRNVGIGYQSLKSNGGFRNVAIGNEAMANSLIGGSNVAIGSVAMRDNNSGSENVALGWGAMQFAESPFFNVAIGRQSLLSNNGSWNVSVGSLSMVSSTTGSHNTTVGAGALSGNTTGSYNVAIGRFAMSSDTSGSDNVAIGSNAMFWNTRGNNNTVIGQGAGSGQEGNHYSGNVLIGHEAGYNEMNSNRLYIDNSGTGFPLIYGEFDNNMMRINGRQEVTGDLTIGDAVTIDESQKRVGIGTLSPSYPLDITGTANLNKGITSGVAMRVNGDEALWYNDNYFSWGHSADHNYFGKPITVGPFEASTTPFAKLHVVDNGFTYMQIESYNDDAILQLSGNTNTAAAGWTIRRDASDGGKLQWRNENFPKMTLTPGGNLGIGVSSNNPAYTLYVAGNAGKTIGGSSWIVASDRRLKQNINPYSEGLSEIMKIKPVTFQYNKLSGRDTTHINVGTIAQELQEVSPHMVSEGKQGYLEVDDSAMTYMLINAVKEMNTNQEKLISMIKDLNEKIEDQQRTIVELKGKQDRGDGNSLAAKKE